MRGLDKRVVGCRVDFDANRFLDALDVLKLGTQPLWGRAERVAILPEDALIVLELDLDLVTLGKLGVREKGPDEVSGFDLAGVRASKADKGIKRATCTQHGFHGQGSQELGHVS